MMEDIRIIFILANKYSKETEASSTMIDAYETCKQHNTNVSWIAENKFPSLSLDKTDFVVLEEFKGKCFDELVKTKCARILGPWAVSVCLIEGKAIPNYPWPIYNVAMYNCVVTSSHLPKSTKAEIKVKVEMMGGCYMDSFVAKSTHLITGSAKSEKYLAAAEAGVKLMCASWIEDLWQTSQSSNIQANDERFNKHRCLPFHNLVISSTGIKISEKTKIERLVKENGGTYSGQLNLKTTDILICAESCTKSEKYQYARQHKNIKCVKSQWVTDSIAKGYALPHTNYQIQKTTSTPNKELDEAVNPEFSILSAIAGPNMSQRQIVEDTISGPWSPRNFVMGKRKAAVPDYGDLIEKLDIKKAKRAGQYLDGCSVYITGFNPEHTEKLNKIINLSGATRYDTYSDRVTHVIVGDSTFHEVKLIRNKGYSSILVTINWLLDSIENEHPVQEEAYLLSSSDFEKSDCGSPLSKKGLNFLRSNKMVTEKDVNSVVSTPPSASEERLDVDVVRHYLKPDHATQEDTLAQLLKENTNFTEKFLHRTNNAKDLQSSEKSTQNSSTAVTQDETDATQIFEHLKFLVIGFEDEEYEIIKEKIEQFSGELVSKSYKGIPDFVVVPPFDGKELHYTATEIVNNLFIYDCEKQQEMILEIAYYHRPFQLPSGKPLQNCYITLSSYSGNERIFLRSLIEALGGIAQEQFARVTSEAKGVVASTHLVSSEATGKKYEAALKWGLPVINKDWLLECAKTGKYINESNFLVGAAEVSLRSLSAQFSDQSGVCQNTTKTTTVTPTNTPGHSRILTPVNQVTPFYKKFLDSAEKPFSQVTPVNKIMQNFRETNSIMNSSLNLPKEAKKFSALEPWMLMKTPETPLGACVTPNPSPKQKKQWEYWLQNFPDRFSPHSTESTPISDIKKKLWDKIGESSNNQLNFDTSVSDDEGNNENILTEKSVQESSSSGTPENQQLTNRLQQLEQMLTASGGGGRRQSRNCQSTLLAPAENLESDSQPCTVGWDYQENKVPQKIKIFSLSGIGNEDTRSTMVKQIEDLGGSVSDLTNYDPSCTHLLCSKPVRNEKTLSCMASGKWILHISYLEKSVEAGQFLNEEEYEYGNRKSSGKFDLSFDKDTELRMQRMYWWRKEISKRGYGAFNDMRAIVIAQKREPMIRVIEAGGGTIIDVKPPFDDTIHATHCLLEQKSVPIHDCPLYIPLARQGVYLLNTVYISDYLHQPQKDIRDCILPFFTKYYARS